MQFSRLTTKENLSGSYNSRSQEPESVINLAPGFKKSQLRITSYILYGYFYDIHEITSKFCFFVTIEGNATKSDFRKKSCLGGL